MDHRLFTPGSHVDWAGSEDDRLPDLDDWGVSPGSSTPADANPDSSESIEKAQLRLMLPILNDSRKQLPQSFDKMSPSPSAGSAPPSPQIADTAPISEVDGFEDGHIKVSDAPSSPIVADEQDPASRSSDLSPREDSFTSPELVPTSKDKDDPPPHL